MLLRFDAMSGGQNGAKFSDIAPEVILLDIIEDPVTMDIKTEPYARGHGQIVSRHARTALTVNLSFVIRTQDIERRTQVCGLVAKWAASVRKLAINTRPGKVLEGKFYTMPTVGSSLQWTQEMQLVFTAYDVPYWQDENTSVSTFISKGDTVKVNCECTADHVPLELMITNDTSKPITEVLIVVAGTYKMHLTGLNLVSLPAEGGFVEEHSLVIEAKDGHTTRIYVTDEENTSMLHTRTADSVDVLTAITTEPTQVYFWADQNATCWLTCKRWWV